MAKSLFWSRVLVARTTEGDVTVLLTHEMRAGQGLVNRSAAANLSHQRHTSFIAGSPNRLGNILFRIIMCARKQIFCCILYSIYLTQKYRGLCFGAHFASVPLRRPRASWFDGSGCIKVKLLV